MPNNNITLEMVAKTGTGMVREGNEDNFVITQDYSAYEWVLPKAEFQNSNTGAVMVVADGMGGLNAGEVASKIVVDSIREYFITKVDSVLKQKHVKDILSDAILYAHQKIIAYGNKNPATEGMGSTIIITWLIENILHVAWVGDSRCYVWRNNTLAQLSKDHSYVQTLVDRGEITMEQAFFHPESNVITQSLGDSDRAPKPDYTAFSLNNNDIVLLCSDGLNGMLQDGEIERIIKLKEGDLAGTADMLITEANEAGGNDNITIAMAKVIDGAVTGALPFTPVNSYIEDSVATIEHRKKKKRNLFLYTGVITVFFALAGFLVIPYFKNNTPLNPKIKTDTTEKSTTDTVAKSMDTLGINRTQKTNSGRSNDTRPSQTGTMKINQGGAGISTDTTRSSRSENRDVDTNKKTINPTPNSLMQ